MSRAAALWAGWDRRAPRSLAGPLAPARGASRPGVPFLQQQFGTAARLVVEVAWAADVEGDPDTWSWTDITTDVRQADGRRVTLTVGRSNHASTSQPATCRFQADNRSGDYSLGGQSRNWPNVRRNVPVRVRVDLGAGPGTRFFGFATSFSPAWDSTGRDAVVNVTANGTLRRLAQGTAPVESVWKKGIANGLASSLLGYWPCEDGEDATQLASGLPGGPPMHYSGNLLLANNSDCPGSNPLPTLNGAIMWVDVPEYEVTGETQLRVYLSIPEGGGGADDKVLCWLVTTGTASQWRIYYRSNGYLTIRAYNTTGAAVLDTTIAFDLNGERGQLILQLTQSGADVDWGLWHTTGGGTSNTLVGYTVGRATVVQLGGDAANETITVGQVILQAEVTHPFEQDALVLGRDGENTTDRLQRLCDEARVPLTVYDGPADLNTHTVDSMGPQGVMALVTLLREVETADQGILFDGLGPGLAYTTRRRRENHPVVLALDASAGDLGSVFEPVDDDAATRNKVTVSRASGSSATYEDADGPQGTTAVGTYNDALRVNCQQDGDLRHYAGWLVHQGTVEGYRYPRLVLNLAKNPGLALAWLQTIPGSRIDLDNAAAIREQLPDQPAQLAVDGWTEAISQFQWDVEANCTPFDPWRVTVLAQDSGDIGEFVGYLDTDGSTLASAVDAGATSLSVATPSGPLWTTDADDFPLYVAVGGVRARVTAVAGASSPQTFTVDPMPAARPANLEVKVWKPTALGL